MVTYTYICMHALIPRALTRPFTLILQVGTLSVTIWHMRERKDQAEKDREGQRDDEMTDVEESNGVVDNSSSRRVSRAISDNMFEAYEVLHLSFTCHSPFTFLTRLTIPQTNVVGDRRNLLKALESAKGKR